MFALFKNNQDDDLREQLARERHVHVIGAYISQAIDSGCKNSYSFFFNVSLIVSYMRDYDIKKITLQPEEKYSIVLSESGNSYEIKEER